MQKSLKAAAIVAAGLLMGTLAPSKAALPQMNAPTQTATSQTTPTLGTTSASACLRRGRRYTVRLRNGRRVRARYVGSRIVRRNGRRYRVYRFRY